MFRSAWKLLVAGVVVVAAFSVSASDADAFCWWGCYRPAVSWYSPCCSVDYCNPCGDSYYVGWRRGPIRRALLGPYRWYRGYGCCSNWSCCSYDVSCCDCAPVTNSPTPAAANKAAPTPAPPQAAPVMPPPVAPQPAVPEAGALEAPAVAPPVKRPAPTSLLPGETRNAPTRETSGLLTVWVPAAARVTINGLETKTSGSRRQYVSHGLKSGLTYKYVVRAEIVRDGKLVAETKTVQLTAGGREGLAFGFNPSMDEGLVSSF